MKTLKTVLIMAIALTTFNSMGQEKSATQLLQAEAATENQNMYIIEREIPGAGNLTSEELKAISQTSCGVLDKMGSEIKWLHSYVTGDKIYCVYMAANEEMVREHAQQGGFPANSVAAVATIIDPSTAGNK
jgi:hypothetical protein